MNADRRFVLTWGVAAGALFLPLPYARVGAQSEGALKLMRLPKIALVVGNGRYRSAPELKNPANDANAIGGTLKAMGFDVTLKLDSSRAEMTSAIQAHVQTLAKRKCVDFRVEQKGLSQIDAPPGTLLAYATSPGNVASDGEGANGLYTEHLLREIQVKEARIEDVFKRVRLGVRRKSNGAQIPWESTSLEEDFYVLPPEHLKKCRTRKRSGCSRKNSRCGNASRTPTSPRRWKIT